MKRAVLLVLIVTAVITIVFVWRDSRKGSGKVHDSFSQIEASLQEGLKRLRAASSTDRKAVTDVMIFADALTEVGDVRQKRVAAAAKKEVGQILFGKGSSAEATAGSAPDEVLLFPGPLPEQHFTPLQIYLGTYAGTVAGRAVSFIVTITKRGLLGIRIVGLDSQPTMEFAEAQAQEFFRPDNKTAFVFADATSRGFRTLYFLQNGVIEKAENISFSPANSE